MLVFDNTQDSTPRIGLGYSKIGEALQPIEENILPNGTYTQASSQAFRADDQSLIGLDIPVANDPTVPTAASPA